MTATKTRRRRQIEVEAQSPNAASASNPVTLPGSQSNVEAQSPNAAGEGTAHATAMSIIRDSGLHDPRDIGELLRTAKLDADQRTALDALAYRALAYKLVTAERTLTPPDVTIPPRVGRSRALAVRDAFREWLEQSDLAADGTWKPLGDLTRADIAASIERRRSSIAAIEGEIAERRHILDAFAKHPKATCVRDLPRAALSRASGVAA